MEGLVVPSNRSLAKAEIGKRHKETAQAALANIAAVKWAYAWALDSGEPFCQLRRSKRSISGSLLLTAGSRRTPAGSGTAELDRQRLVHACWRRLHSATARGRAATAGGSLSVPRSGRPSPVAQAAIAHVQFETIHPFPDGNGRGGVAALIGASLRVAAASVGDVVPPISLVLAGRKDDYVDALTAFRHGEDDPWLLLLAESAEQAARASIELADQIAGLQNQWREQTGHPRSDSAAEQIVATAGGAGLDIERAATRLKRSPEAARQALNRLEQSGVVQLTVSKRDRAWESAAYSRSWMKWSVD